MEFQHGRKDGFHCEEEDLEKSSKHPPFIASSSSSSSSTLRWVPSTDGGSGTAEPTASPIEREHMFDKVVTPSDVGKLNRLVIPKQHAEKYFPLDPSTNEKGLLLNFEDRTGKPWRFRYSYWNSSQSYVMTKGWSRFVKEKRLDAGDTVSFGRGIGESGKDRLFIDWKRRPEPHDPPRLPRLPLPLPANHPMVSFARSVGPWAGRILVPPAAYDHHRQSYGYNATSPGSTGGQYFVFRSAVAPPQVGVQHGNTGGDRTVGVPMVLDSVPVVHSQAAAKRVRLFGVNLDFPESDGDPADGSLRSQRVLQLQLGGLESSGPFSSSSSSPSPRGKDKQPSLDLDIVPKHPTCLIPHMESQELEEAIQGL